MKLIAHRANNDHKYKENSLNGIINSLEKDYIDGIEIDIRMTKDNHFILHHNVIYENHIIENRTLKQLKNLDEINNVLKKIKSKKIILLDLKCENLDYKNYADKLIKQLKKYKNLNIYLCSFNYELSCYLKEKTKYKIGIFVSSIINKNKKIDVFDFVAYNYKVYKKIDKMTMIWTVNKREILAKFVNKNVYIITDKAYLLK